TRWVSARFHTGGLRNPAAPRIISLCFLRYHWLRFIIALWFHAGGNIMWTILGSKKRLCDGMTRREALKAGALTALGGFGLPQLLSAEERRPAEHRSRAKNVIVLYLLGGAATQDMWDLKPNAPSEIGGEFRPIATNVPGIQISECLPR